MFKRLDSNPFCSTCDVLLIYERLDKRQDIYVECPILVAFNVILWRVFYCSFEFSLLCCSFGIYWYINWNKLLWKIILFWTHYPCHMIYMYSGMLCNTEWAISRPSMPCVQCDLPMCRPTESHLAVTRRVIITSRPYNVLIRKAIECLYTGKRRLLGVNADSL